jgi:hypothetical protein
MYDTERIVLPQGISVSMINNRQAVELIEQAQTNRPYCGCGQSTMAIGRGDGVWLECLSFETRSPSFVRRLLTADLGIHTRELILDLTPEESAVA